MQPVLVNRSDRHSNQVQEASYGDDEDPVNLDEQNSVQSQEGPSSPMARRDVVHVGGDPDCAACCPGLLGLANRCTKYALVALAAIVLVNILAPITIIFSPVIIFANAMMHGAGEGGIGRSVGNFAKNLFAWLERNSWEWPTNDDRWPRVGTGIAGGRISLDAVQVHGDDHDEQLDQGLYNEENTPLQTFRPFNYPVNGQYVEEESGYGIGYMQHTFVQQNSQDQAF